jgi:hypothetical protein
VVLLTVLVLATGFLISQEKSYLLLEGHGKFLKISQSEFPGMNTGLARQP